MHMRIRYHFLADLHVTIQAHETESEKHIQILQTNLLEFNLLQAKIVIIDPMPYQSTHFLHIIYIENSPMDLSRESQTSTNTPEFDHQQR